MSSMQPITPILYRTRGFTARLVISIGRVIALLGLGIFCLWTPANAQTIKVPKIAVLLPSDSKMPMGQGLYQGLHELGYVEGKNILIERRTDEYGPQLKSLAAELTLAKVDLIVATSTPAARTMLDHTTAPVVFVAGGTPWVWAWRRAWLDLGGMTPEFR
jgi:ABC-type uncharacterized transport system substrate-binding protein